MTGYSRGPLHGQFDIAASQVEWSRRIVPIHDCFHIPASTTPMTVGWDIWRESGRVAKGRGPHRSIRLMESAAFPFAKFPLE